MISFGYNKLILFRKRRRSSQNTLYSTIPSYKSTGSTTRLMGGEGVPKITLVYTNVMTLLEGEGERKGRSPFSLHQCYNTFGGGEREEGKAPFSVHQCYNTFGVGRERKGRPPLAYTKVHIITLLEGGGGKRRPLAYTS